LALHGDLGPSLLLLIPVHYTGSGSSLGYSETEHSQMERKGSLPVPKHACTASDMLRSSRKSAPLVISPLKTAAEKRML